MSPVEATVQVTDLTGYEAVSDAGTGYYEITEVPVGLHDVRVSATGYQTIEREGVLVEDGAIANEDFILASPAFYDAFELGTGEWTGDWSLTTEEANTPTHSLTESPGGGYGNHDYKVATLAQAIDLSNAESAELSFWHRYQTESNYDFCYVELSGNGGSSWTRVATFDGYLADWTEVRIDLEDYLDSTGFKVRFIFDSDGWIQYDGWYVDDVAIFASSDSSDIEETLVSTLRVMNHPNPFRPKTSIRYDVPVRGDVDLAVYDVSGRLVRTLLAAEPHGAGTYGIPWDGRNDGGQEVAGGVYFARVGIAGGAASAKMVLLK
jgi:hypothetical protein